MSPIPGTVSWFEIGAADPAATERFYGELFGWRFTPDPGSPGYRLIHTGADAPPTGGVATSGGATPDYAVFYVKVPDVAAALQRATALGAVAAVTPSDRGDGLVFAQLRDPAGNLIGLFQRGDAG